MVLAGCNLLRPPPAPSFALAIVVDGDPGEALEGATVTYKGKTVGVTDKTGKVQIRLKGPEGQVFALGVQCPEGHQSPTEPVAVTLRRIAERDATPEYKVSCPRAMRKVVVAVRAERGADLPVVYLGKELTRTDQSGAAHIVLDVPPNQAFQLKLNTDSNSRLLPQNPTTTFEVKDADEVFVFDPQFKLEKPKYRYRGPSRPKGPTPI